MAQSIALQLFFSLYAQLWVVLVLSFASSAYRNVLVHLQIIGLKKCLGWASLADIADIVIVDALVVLHPDLLHNIAEVFVEGTLLKIRRGFFLIGPELFKFLYEYTIFMNYLFSFLDNLLLDDFSFEELLSLYSAAICYGLCHPISTYS